jgi:hypothetical protein
MIRSGRRQRSHTQQLVVHRVARLRCCLNELVYFPFDLRPEFTILFLQLPLHPIVRCLGTLPRNVFVDRFDRSLQLPLDQVVDYTNRIFPETLVLLFLRWSWRFDVLDASIERSILLTKPRKLLRLLTENRFLCCE